jgi:hypothetical protein
VQQRVVNIGKWLPAIWAFAVPYQESGNTLPAGQFKRSRFELTKTQPLLPKVRAIRASAPKHTIAVAEDCKFMNPKNLPAPSLQGMEAQL